MDNLIESEQLISPLKKVQQEYYELLPDWTLYKKEDYEILQFNVGYALFGLPKDSCTSENGENAQKELYTMDYISGVKFSEKAVDTMSLILSKIFEYGKMTNENIYCGFIYNITFDDTGYNIYPIFKIIHNSETPKKKDSSKNIVSCNNANNDVWYIDHDGRTYTNWQNYKDTNTLPPCIMVIPKNGQYQANPACELTETSSTVWLEIIPSPACSQNSKLCNTMDKASTILTLGGLGVGLVSLVTPIGAPLALAGLIGTGISSTWTAGRSVNEIIDRRSHKESISLTNRAAFRAWLGVAGSAMGLATSGGTMLLSKTAQTGANIGRSVRMVYNATVIGNLSVNFAGLGYNGYCLWEKYQTENHIDLVDVLFFTSHLMFFGNAVASVRFASEIIKSTQGNIMKDYEATLRSKRHRKSYNRLKRKASTTSEIVRHIRKVETKQELLGLKDTLSKQNYNTSKSILPTFTDSKVILGNVTLFDPVVFAKTCLNTHNLHTSLLKSTVQLIYNDLRVILSNCLRKYYEKYPFTQNIALADFDSILREMQHIKNGEQVLELIMEIVFKIIVNSNILPPFTVQVVSFIWKYAKSHLVGMETGSHDSDCKVLMKIILAIRDNIHELMNRFLIALHNHFEAQSMLY